MSEHKNQMKLKRKRGTRKEHERKKNDRTVLEGLNKQRKRNKKQNWEK